MQSWVAGQGLFALGGAMARGQRTSSCVGDHAVARYFAFLSALCAATLSLAASAAAARPYDRQSHYEDWFQSLEQPGGRHLLCCAVADCHLTSSRQSPIGYEVLIEGAWVMVPGDRVLQQVRNPTGQAVVCYRRVVEPLIERSDIIIFCFVRPPEA